MSMSNNIFERFLYEASDDDPPDTTAPDIQQPDTSGPPDIPDGAATDNGPPDIPDDGDNDMGVDDGAPPDIGGEDDTFGGDDGFTDDNGDDGAQENDPNNLELDEKISAIMNMNLYQRYLSLLNNITNQIAMIKDNNDILYTLSPESLDIQTALKKLDENVHLYLTNNFLNENYSKNLLFFNKCLNLLKLLNDAFNEKIQKGIKAIK